MNSFKLQIITSVFPNSESFSFCSRSLPQTTTAMDQGNSPDTAPQDHPKSPSDILCLKEHPECVREDRDYLKECLEETVQQRNRLQTQAKTFFKKTHKDKHRINRLEELLEIRDRLFKEDNQKSYEIISKQESEIFFLKKKLEQFQVQQVNIVPQQVDVIPHQSKQDHDEIGALQKLSEQNVQILKLMCESQKSSMLQKELQKKLIHVEQQLHQRDKEILDLRREKHGLAQRPTEATNRLWSNGAEFFQSDKLRLRKYKVLQEKFRKELAKKEQRWETRINQLEEEKNELEDLCLKMKKNRKSFWSI